MKKIVINASHLIFASKIPKILDLLRKTYDKLLVTEQVYEEVMENGLQSEKQPIRENAKRLEKILEQEAFERMHVDIKKDKEESLV